MKLLIVDDSPTHTYLCQQLLKGLNIDADMATDGEAALKAVAANYYDGIFLDMLMPKLNGTDVAEKIRSGEAPSQNTDIYIIGMSGNTESEYRDICLAAGMNDFSEKPMSREAFIEKLDALRHYKETISH